MSKQTKDPGFGRVYETQTKRFINKDGTLNTIKKGLQFTTSDFYLVMVNMSWGYFIFMIFIAFLIINSFFAGIYLMIGIEDLSVPREGSFLDQFLYAFYFSSQTFTTVGYGAIAPKGHLASIIASLEGMVGLCGFAFATGLLWGRFSRPNIRLVFSEQMIVAPYKDHNAIMFRVANARKNVLMELEVSVTVSVEKQNDDKTFNRSYYRLDLEMSKINFMASTWTLVHPINKDSPFFNWTKEDFDAHEGELLILLKAYDETYSNHVHRRFSYLFNELVYGAKFIPAFHHSKDGDTVVDMDKISDFENVPLNP